MSEHHDGPYRGPISGGLPGLLVAAFALGLTVWLVRSFVPLGILVGLVVAGVAFFVALRLPWRR